MTSMCAAVIFPTMGDAIPLNFCYLVIISFVFLLIQIVPQQFLLGHTVFSVNILHQSAHIGFQCNGWPPVCEQVYVERHVS